MSDLERAAPDATLADEREAVENLMQCVRSCRDEHGIGTTPSNIIAALTCRAAALYELASVAGDRDAVRLANDAQLLAVADRPVIAADNGDLETMADDCWRALERHNDPRRLFRYGGLPVRLERDDDGAPVVRWLNVDRMRHELARSATWVRGKKQTPARPPLDGVRDLLATPEPKLPKLTRIVEVPVLGPNGELASAPGYHEATATYYAPADGLVIPDVPETPTAAEVVAARTVLMDELLGEFPFVGEEERAHAIALLLLPFVRDLIDGPTPLHLIEKPAPGTGGTLLADMLALPATAARFRR